MKKLFFLFAMVSMLAFTACDDDDDKGVAVNNTVKSFIENRYQGASIRHAEYEANGLLEVEFIHDSKIKDAYFKSDNEWVYTEWDVALSSLPAAVKDAVTTAYPDYRIDDADFIEVATGTYYEIEIEKDGVDRWIYVTPNGVIHSEGIDSDSPTVTDTMKQFIESRYPGAVIRNSEYNDTGLLEIEFVHDSIVKEAYFNNAGEWVYTEWDVAISKLPQAVTDAAALAYPDYRIDDADFIERSEISYYKIELEKGNFEQWLYVTPDGRIITE